MLTSIFGSEAKKSLERSFKQWSIFTLNHREEQQAEEYRLQLLTAESVRIRREEELMQLLHLEKQASLSEQGKFRSQIRRLEEDRRKEREEAVSVKEELRSKNVQSLVALEESRRIRAADMMKRFATSFDIVTMQIIQTC